jgi:hypothetical protein
MWLLLLVLAVARVGAAVLADTAHQLLAKVLVVAPVQNHA